MANKIPYDVYDLPKWARDLIEHLMAPIGTCYTGFCKCGYPKEDGYICQKCGEDSGRCHDWSTRFDGLEML